MSQVTIPEGRTYAWEGRVSINYGTARMLANNMPRIAFPLKDAIDEAQRHGKKLTGPRLKQLVVAVARAENWVKRLPSPVPVSRPFLADDPATRRCTKCGIVQPIAHFMREATLKQKAIARQNQIVIEGQKIGLANSNYLRGYIRPERPLQRVSMKCRTCWGIRKPARPDSPDCAALRADIAKGLEAVSSNLQSVKRMTRIDVDQRKRRVEYYAMRRILLRQALSHLNMMKRKKVTRYPSVWTELIAPHHWEELANLYDSVNWHQRPNLD